MPRFVKKTSNDGKKPFPQAFRGGGSGEGIFTFRKTQKIKALTFILALLKLHSSVNHIDRYPGGKIPVPSAPYPGIGAFHREDWVVHLRW